MEIITQPTKIDAAGSAPKIIMEFIGRVNSKNSQVSVARMKSSKGWSEPGQTPQFDEYTVVLKGCLVVENKKGKHKIKENQAVITTRGEWVRYSAPYDGGAEYIAICIPAFSPDLANRD